MHLRTRLRGVGKLQLSNYPLAWSFQFPAPSSHAAHSRRYEMTNKFLDDWHASAVLQMTRESVSPSNVNFSRRLELGRGIWLAYSTYLSGKRVPSSSKKCSVWPDNFVTKTMSVFAPVLQLNLIHLPGHLDIHREVLAVAVSGPSIWTRFRECFESI